MIQGDYDIPKGSQCDLCIGSDRYKDKFHPTCSCTTDIQLAATDVSSLNDGEREVHRIFTDPVLFAKNMFEFEARWYQMEMLRCTSMKQVYRCGRRVGKTTSLAIKTLHKSFINEGFKTIIIAPYDEQVVIVFDMVRKMIRSSKYYSDCISRDIANPHRIELSNGSIIRGITAGVKTGMAADKVRGSDADMLILDEVDMLGQKDLESILAIVASKPDVDLIASSTPTGKRELFYKWCTNPRLGFKQFHYPSSVNPAWNEETEEFFRSTYTEVGYKHEFDAEFAEQELGVFSHQHVTECVRNGGYAMNSVPVDGNMLYGMGVDWNDVGVGVRICVVEYNPSSEMFRPVKCIAKDDPEFTQHASVEEVIKENSRWSPKVICVDKGFGHANVEMLKKYGLENRSSRLHKIVKPIDMRGKIEIRDPMTGKMVKKRSKPFIVNLAARRIESHQVLLPSGCDKEGELVWEMMEYRVKRLSSDGTPVYTDGNDHYLTSFMLALFGIIHEFSDFSKVKRTGTVRLITRMRQDIPAHYPPEIASEIRNGMAESARNEHIERKKRLAPMPRMVSSVGDGTLIGIFEQRREFNIQKKRARLRSANGTGRRRF